MVEPPVPCRSPGAANQRRENGSKRPVRPSNHTTVGRSNRRRGACRARIRGRVAHPTGRSGEPAGIRTLNQVIESPGQGVRRYRIRVRGVHDVHLVATFYTVRRVSNGDAPPGFRPPHPAVDSARPLAPEVAVVAVDPAAGRLGLPFRWQPIRAVHSDARGADEPLSHAASTRIRLRHRPEDYRPRTAPLVLTAGAATAGTSLPTATARRCPGGPTRPSAVAMAGPASGVHARIRGRLVPPHATAAIANRIRMSPRRLPDVADHQSAPDS